MTIDLPLAYRLDPKTLFGGGLLLLATFGLLHVTRSWQKLSSIPTLGGTDLPLLSYATTVRSFALRRKVLQEGYERFKGRAFKIALPDRWLVIVSGDALVDELRRLPSEVMSFAQGITVLLEGEYTFGREVAANQWHVDVIRDQFAKRLDSVFPVVHDEITAALEDYIGDASTDWVALPVLKTLRKTICRASNRVFVGLPKCRDPDYVDLNVEFTTDVSIGAFTISLFPTLLKPLVGRWLTTVPVKSARAFRHLSSLVEERRQLTAEYGADHPDKPNDFLTWSLESEPGSRASVNEITHRILSVNFAAVHTTANTCAHALYTLAANPQYLAPLREEVETVIGQYGWTKSAMSELVKLDSFIKEANRLFTFQSFGTIRKAMKTHTFRDGTTVPAGTIVASPIFQVHGDPQLYDHADEFVPFRFVEEPASKRPFTSTYNEHLTFGHGKQACPGRFFAVSELKLILAYLVLNYDIRAEVEGVRPANFMRGFSELPNQTATVLVKKRAA